MAITSSASSRTSSPLPFPRPFRFSTYHNDRVRPPPTTALSVDDPHRSPTSSLRSLSAEASIESQPVCEYSPQFCAPLVLPAWRRVSRARDLLPSPIHGQPAVSQSLLNARGLVRSVHEELLMSSPEHQLLIGSLRASSSDCTLYSNVLFAFVHLPLPFGLALLGCHDYLHPIAVTSSDRLGGTTFYIHPTNRFLPVTDPFNSHSSASSSMAAYDTSPPAAPPPPALPKRARNSILFASGFHFHRPRGRGKQKSPPPAPTPFMFSEVIEIGPPARSEEDEERERLRDAAAQSIGLDPVLLEEHAARPPDDDSSDDGVHTRSATPMPALPPFPSTHAALLPYALLSARLPKHYPPSSLLIFALARQWKMRVLVLTSVGRTTGLGSGLAADSVVFMADQDVGGRRGVVKVGGPDSAEMTLQIVDAEEAQSWIAAIKQAVLTQRSIRAGLGIMAHSFSGAEPRGDLDVMLSMRAQGMLSSPTASSFSPDFANSTSSSPPQRSSSGTRSPSTAVSALRGLFTGSATRPRSPSMASTLGDPHDDDDPQQEESFGRAGNSLLSMLRSSSVTNDRPMSPVSPTLALTPVSTSTTPSTPRMPDASPFAQAQLDRKILQDQDQGLEEARPIVLAGSGYGLLPAVMGQDDSHIFRRVGSPSLQPPPRKRAWTSSGTPPPRTRPDGVPPTYTHANGSTADSFGIRPAGTSAFLTAPPSPPQLSPGSTHSHPEGRTRTSVSSASSGDHRVSSDYGSKRWSRQGILPNRLTPPSGPPPAPPLSQSPPSFRSSIQRHPYAADNSPSRSPSLHSGPQNHGTFSSKRTSGSSMHSFSTVSTSQHSPNGGTVSLFGTHRPLSSHRLSAPPPQRPAPSTALPPTPHEDTSAPPPAYVPPPVSPSKTSFRESLVLRTHRLSLAPPSLPPTGKLPPRPDEPATRASHHRSSSSSHIPLSPIPASPLVPPYPPPRGPLPLPPPQQQQPTSRAASIRQRLRMLSSPAAPPTPPSPAPSTINPYSLPSTPIGEPITTLQNDPTFLLSASPTPPPPMAPTPLAQSYSADAPEYEYLGITSLSPPPRRRSRRASKAEEELKPRPSTADDADTSAGLQRHVSVSLSPQPSAVSLVDVCI
ncbi:hypothetical protein B0H21DRAFT_834517 [Amylocystis lapponica]|nr:hypothetical protein B0H21DRAFT_834517 [Amylocystis lapponica]